MWFFHKTISGKKHIPLVLLILVTAPVLWADTLELSNGDIISGLIVGMDEKTVTIRTQYGTLQVERAYVTAGKFGEENDSAEVTKESDKQEVTTGPDPVHFSEASVPQEGMSAEFLLNGSFEDSSGSGLVLQNINDAVFDTGIEGTEKSAVSSDGSGRFLYLENTSSIDSLESMTLSLWVKARYWNRSGYILSKWKDTWTDRKKAEGKIALHTGQGTVTLYIVDVSGTYHSFTASGSLKTGIWNHIAVTCSAGKVILYINGKTAASGGEGFDGLMKDTSPLYILTAAARKGKHGEFYNIDAAIDNIRIYARPLDVAEIAGLFHEGKKTR